MSTDKHVLAELENIGRCARTLRKSWDDLPDERRAALRRLIFKAHRELYDATMLAEEEVTNAS